MFSLKQKNKNNNQQPNKTPPKQNTNKHKPQSKKLTKTIFQDPFNYRIELLPQQDSYQVIQLLTKYITKLRESMPLKPARQGLTKTIKFQTDKNIKQKLSPLISQQLSMGIKKTKSILYNYYKNNKNKTQIKRIPYLTIIFYDEKKHQILQQLLCLLKALNTPYLLIKDNLQINRLLGLRTVGSLCLFNQNFANSLLKYIGKCLIDIPWLVQIDQICKFSIEQ